MIDTPAGSPGSPAGPVEGSSGQNDEGGWTGCLPGGPGGPPGRPVAPTPVPTTSPAPRGAQNGPQSLRLDYVSRPWQASGRLPDRADGEKGHITRAQLDHLARVLADVPYLMADLEVAASRQDQFPNRPTPAGDGSESPLPYRTGAADTSHDLALAVSGVAALVWHRSTSGQPVPFRSATEAAGWLRSSLRILAQDPDAEQLAYRIADVHDRALNGPIERPPDWRYLGPCRNCGADLEAESGSEMIECDCGYRAAIQDVIDSALASTEDMLFTETQLVGALELDGKIITRYQIQGWHRRGRLAGHEHKRWAPKACKIVSVRTYRLGDVRKLVAEMEDRRRYVD